MNKNKDGIYREISIIDEELFWETNEDNIKKLNNKKKRLQKRLKKNTPLEEGVGK